MLDDEVWRDIIGYEGFYQISNKCRIRSLYNYKRDGTNILKPKIKRGYYQIGLRKDGVRKWYQVHRLLAQAFIPNPNNLPCVNHKDENKTNNELDNLEWCTTSYNNTYGTRIERVRERTSKKVLKYDLNGNFLERYVSVTDAGRKNNVSPGNIVSVCKGYYKQIKGYIYRYE